MNLRVLEEGYHLCWNRFRKGGYDVVDHTFEAYCQDLARERDVVGSSTRPNLAKP